MVKSVKKEFSGAFVGFRVRGTHTCSGKHLGINRYVSVLLRDFVSDEVVDLDK